MKPTLFNGQIVSRRHHIVKRIDFGEYFELYLINTNSYLVLFLINLVDHRDFDLDFKITKLNNVNYKYLIFDESYSPNKIKNILKSIFDPKGLGSVAGMETLKNIFRKDIIEPLNNKERFEKFKIDLPNAILLFGPPGCGKTYFVKKIAEEIGFNLILTSQSTYGSSFIHGTSMKIKEVFQEAIKNAPTLLFIDEIDSLFPKRENLGSSSQYKQEEINEFLVQMNNLNKSNVLLIAATNKPQLLDEALLRTGRMDKLIYVGLPDFQSRIELFKFYFRDRPVDLIEFEPLALLTDGYSCSDIEYICNEAAKDALYKNQDFITPQNIDIVLEKMKPSISKDAIETYKDFESFSRY